MTGYRPSDTTDPYPVAPRPLSGAGLPPDVAAGQSAAIPAPDAPGYPQAPYGRVAPVHGQPPYPQPGTVPPGYAQAPVQVVYVQAPTVGPDGRPLKSRVAAGLMAFFVGTVGVHNFYLGQMWRGIAHVALAGVPAALLLIFSVAGFGALDDASSAWLGVFVYGYWLGLVFSLIFGVNQLWAIIEGVIILVSKDPSLR